MAATFRDEGVLPHVRLLMILRNPVARAISGYYQLRNFHKTDPQVKGTGGSLDIRALRAMKSLFGDEIRLLKRCHKHLSLTQGCHGASHQLDHFLECVAQAKKDLDLQGQWFQRFSNDTLRWQQTGLVFHEGMLLRGYYADQIRNFLCAGFKPEQLILATSSELRNDMGKVLDRIADAFGQRRIQQWSMDEARANSQTALVPSKKNIQKLLDFMRPQVEELIDLVENEGINANVTALRKELLEMPKLSNRTLRQVRSIHKMKPRSRRA